MKLGHYPAIIAKSILKNSPDIIRRMATNQIQITAKCFEAIATPSIVFGFGMTIRFEMLIKSVLMQCNALNHLNTPVIDKPCSTMPV